MRQWLPIDAATAEPSAPSAPTASATASTRIAVRPWTRGATRAVLLVVAASLALTGWWWWAGRPREAITAPTVLATGPAIRTPAVGPDPAAEPGAGDEPPTGVSAPVLDGSAGEVVVHVTGQVARPGLVTLAAGSRIADAVAAAGGVTRRRASETVNLARVLVDGEQIVVGASTVGSAPPAPGTPSPASSGPVDLNTADARALEALPGVGPVLAGRIVDWRALNGPFRSIDELGEVSGIGDATLTRLRSLVRV